MCLSSGREVLWGVDVWAGEARDPVLLGAGPRRVTHHRQAPGLTSHRGSHEDNASKVGMAPAAHSLSGDSPEVCSCFRCHGNQACTSKEKAASIEFISLTFALFIWHRPCGVGYFAHDFLLKNPIGYPITPSFMEVCCLIVEHVDCYQSGKWESKYLPAHAILCFLPSNSCLYYIVLFILTVIEVVGSSPGRDLTFFILLSLRALYI